MKKLYQLLGNNAPTPGLLGIEIEAEGMGMRAVQTAYWRSENDGSLRGHYPESKAEFVLNKPIALKNVVPAMKELIKTQEGAEFDFSYRTSVHVHVNVTDLTYDQVFNIVYTYLLLEEPMMTYCGKSRKANRFCLRLADAEGLMDTIALMAKRGEDSHGLANDNVRYSSINLAALAKYGSLEFRGMRGTMDTEVIDTWTKALVAIREYAIKFDSPEKIQEEMKQLGAEKFLAKVIGQELAAVFTYPKLVKDMARSFSLSIDLPYAVKKRLEKPVAPKGVLKGGVIGISDDVNVLKLYFIGAAELDEHRIDGHSIVYRGDLYVHKGGRFHGLGNYDGPPEDVINEYKRVYA